MGKIASLQDCFDIAERTYSQGSDPFKKGKDYCPTYSELENWFGNTPTLGLSLKGTYKSNQLVQASDIEKRDMNCYFWFQITNAFDYPNAKFSRIGIDLGGEYHEYDPNSYNPSYTFPLTGNTSYSIYSISITYQRPNAYPVTAGHSCMSGNMSGMVQPGQTIVVEFRIEY